MAASAASAISAQKSRDFQGPPLQTARETDFPPSKSIRPAPYKKNRYICHFMDKRFQGPFRDGLMCVSQIWQGQMSILFCKDGGAVRYEFITYRLGWGGGGVRYFMNS
jgi:hypothetical protein